MIKETGGARIGMMNATWPFAKLTVTQDRLTLNATILGKFTFKSTDIIAIQPYTVIPFFGQGIRIQHRNGAYNSKIIFWTFKSPATLISEIKQTGFLNQDESKSPDQSVELGQQQQSSGGFPLKIGFAIAVLVLWNVLFFVDTEALFQRSILQFGFGKGVLLSTGMALITCVLLLFVPFFQKIALKKGRNIKDISVFIYFAMFIVGVLFLSRIFF